MLRQTPERLSDATFCFVVTTCRKDFHYARVLLESLNYFHPDTPAKIIVDGDGSSEFLRKIPNVISIDHTADLHRVHGLDLRGLLSDLNLFLFDDFDYYIRVDADSVFIGDILGGIQSRMPFDFLSLDGKYLDLNNEKDLKLFSQYAFSPDAISRLGEDFPLGRTMFFSGGHFCAKRGLLSADFIAKWRPYLSPEFGKSSLFRFNDQSLMNFAVNSLSRKNLIKAGIWQVTINGKSPETNYPEVSPENMLANVLFDRKIIHFTGPSRKWRFKDHNFGWALVFFDARWYKRVGWRARVQDAITEFGSHFTKRKTWSALYRSLKGRILATQVWPF